MIRVPLFLPARLRPRTGPPPPRPPEAPQPPPPAPAPRPASTWRRPTAYRTTYEHDGTAWAAAEAAVLDRLAAAGGDLAAHRKIHLKGRR